MSFVADSYLETPEGRAEAERAKREGSRLYLQAKEVILRPNVAGGLAGICECTLEEIENELLTHSQHCRPRHSRLLRLPRLEPPLGPPHCCRCYCWSPCS